MEYKDIMDNIELKCPKCGKRQICEIDKYIFNYPYIVDILCSRCNEIRPFKIKLEISSEPVNQYCKKCHRGIGFWAAPDESPCSCKIELPRPPAPPPPPPIQILKEGSDKPIVRSEK